MSALPPPRPPRPADPEESGGGLPFDPMAALAAFLLWRWWLAGAVAVSSALGLLLAVGFAQREYAAETVMLYKAPAEGTPEAAATPSLLTLMRLVKLPANIELLRQRTGIEADVRTVGAATDVTLQPKTTMVVISARWESPRTAAEIANGLRDAFLENQMELRRRDAERQAGDIAARLATVGAELSAAEEALRAFASENRVVNLTEEARATLSELASVNLLYEQALIEKRSVDLQVANAERLTEELKELMKKEQEAAASMSDALSETNIRIQRLRESIQDDKLVRENDALLDEARTNLERLTRLYEEGAVPLTVVDEAATSLKALEARAVDTPQILEWKSQIEELDKKVIPSAEARPGVTGDLLKGIMMKSFELRLLQTSSQEKVDALSKAQDRVEVRLARMPDLERRHATLARAVEAAEAEKRGLEARLATSRRLLEASALPFTLVSEAAPPRRASRSNAKKIAAGVAVLGSGAAFVLFLGLAVLDPRVRSRADLARRLGGGEVLAEFPELPADQAAGVLGAAEEPARALARKLRAAHPGAGARLLFASAGHGEGTTFCMLAVAELLARRGERVLVLDLAVRAPLASAPRPASDPLERARRWLREFQDCGVARTQAAGRTGAKTLPEGSEAPLADAFAGRADGAPFASPCAIEGVWIAAPAAGSLHPDALADRRASEFFARCSREFDVVLAQTTPVLLAGDAETLAPRMDAVVLVARAFGPHGGAIAEAVERLRAAGGTIAGAVLARFPQPKGPTTREGGDARPVH
ncbi:MAG: hypothetical protein SF028_04240 [Candidatus Sumerlaeia bacterium]|nr:hypothetical protein [Candidatus Sumerlaeia bacterium]